MKLSDIDKAMLDTEAKQRKSYLIRTLKAHGQTQDRLGRNLEDLRLPELEWLNIEVQNEVARKYANIVCDTRET